MNAEGDIRRIDQFGPGEKVTPLTDEMAAALVKIEKHDRHRELARLQRVQFSKENRTK